MIPRDSPYKAFLGGKLNSMVSPPHFGAWGFSILMRRCWLTDSHYQRIVLLSGYTSLDPMGANMMRIVDKSLRLVSARYAVLQDLKEGQMSTREDVRRSERQEGSPLDRFRELVEAERLRRKLVRSRLFRRQSAKAVAQQEGWARRQLKLLIATNKRYATGGLMMMSWWVDNSDRIDELKKQLGISS